MRAFSAQKYKYSFALAIGESFKRVSLLNIIVRCDRSCLARANRQTGTSKIANEVRTLRPRWFALPICPYFLLCKFIVSTIIALTRDLHDVSLKRRTKLLKAISGNIYRERLAFSNIIEI